MLLVCPLLSKQRSSYLLGSFGFVSSDAVDGYFVTNYDIVSISLDSLRSVKQSVFDSLVNGNLRFKLQFEK